MFQHIFQAILILVSMLAGLSKSYPVGQRELNKNGPDSSEIIGEHIDERPGKDNKVVSSEISAVEGREFIQNRPEPGEITRGDTRERPIGDIEDFDDGETTYPNKVNAKNPSKVKEGIHSKNRIQRNVDTERCPNEMYGVKCTMPCPINCQGNCNRNTGYCSGCKDKGHYGNLCEMICVQCNNLSCYFFDGTCIEGDNATYVNMNSSTDRPMKNIDDKIKVGSSDISLVERRKFVQYRPEPREITRGDTIEKPRVDIEVGPFDANALVSGEVTSKGFVREHDNRNNKEIQDIEDDNGPLGQWYFNMNVKVFNRTLFGNFSRNSFLIFLMSVVIIIAIVGMYVLCKHSPGAI